MNFFRSVTFPSLHSTLLSILATDSQSSSSSAFMWRTPSVHLDNVSRIQAAYILDILLFHKFHLYSNSVIYSYGQNCTFSIPTIAIIFKHFMEIQYTHIMCTQHTCIVLMSFLSYTQLYDQHKIKNITSNQDILPVTTFLRITIIHVEFVLKIFQFL